MTPQETLQAVALVRAACIQGDKMSDETARVYQRMLADLPYPETEAAIMRLAAKDSRFILPISEIRAAVQALSGGAPRSAIEAWAELSEACVRVGQYGNEPKWTDPVLARCVRAFGGWVAICQDDNDVALRAHFLKHYSEIASSEALEARLPPALRSARYTPPDHGALEVARHRELERAANQATPPALPAAPSPVETFALPPPREPETEAELIAKAAKQKRALLEWEASLTEPQKATGT